MEKYKSKIAFALALIYLIAGFQFTFPYLSYYSNYTYFATEACVNRHNPDLECDGKCQLTKMVKNQHDHDQSIPDQALSIDKTSSSTIFFWEAGHKILFPLNKQPFYRNNPEDTYFYLFHTPPTPPPQLG